MAYVLHQLLTETAARRPDAEAVRLLDQALTYAELEKLSNQLAHALIEIGVVPGDRIGIYLHKSPSAIVSIFGIMKTGACYVPVDPNAPGLRLAEIARQCAFRALITSDSLYEKLRNAFLDECPMAAIFFIDKSPDVPLSTPAFTFADSLPSRSVVPPAVSVIDQDIAYILFTSGSTGNPKGVMLSHLNALTFVNWACDTFAVAASDRLSSHAPLNFDLSVFDIFAAIKAGAAISLVPEGLSVFPVELASFIENEGITIWYSVPMVLTMLTRGKLHERDLNRLRLVLFAGEVFPIKHLRNLRRMLPKSRLANLYGPTETNVCTWYEVGQIPENQTTPVPIGKPCANMTVIAMDEVGRQVVAPGEEGMLYARGSNVMQGYYGRPSESAACFISNPFAPGRDEKLYCTGDWVTLDENGDFLLIGRKDHMIKTRGYRVELGEIEAVMVAHPAINEAVALAIPDEAIGNSIRAIVTANNDGDVPSSADLKRHCAEKLPPYMVPEEIEFRDVLPRTGTGKIDRQRLQGEIIRRAAK
ncbi:MAG TPA: amino acid adenylation domain-containing protein [Chthoniobacterales bacterium]|nr:amino acid adenylation domain-containing protein [Chthoniobacterales bacterium]